MGKVTEIRKANGEVMRIIDGEYVIGAGSGCFSSPKPCRKIIGGEYLVEKSLETLNCFEGSIFNIKKVSNLENKEKHDIAMYWHSSYKLTVAIKYNEKDYLLTPGWGSFSFPCLSGTWAYCDNAASINFSKTIGSDRDVIYFTTANATTSKIISVYCDEKYFYLPPGWYWFKIWRNGKFKDCWYLSNKPLRFER